MSEESYHDIKTNNNEIQLVVFQLGEEEYGIDVSQVKEIIKMRRVTKVPRSPKFVEGVINLRGQLTTVMDLRKRFNIGAGDMDDNTRIVVAEVKNNPIGIIVDSVSAVLKVPEKDIDQTPSAIAAEIDAEFLKGVGKVGERLIILLDLARVLTQGEIEHIETITKEKEKIEKTTR